jgi:hypothetical protein
VRQKTTKVQPISEEEGARELQRLRPLLDSSDEHAGPLEIDQLPLKPRLQSDADLGALMGFQPAATEGIRKARNAILLSLRLALETGRGSIHYSRDRNSYTRQKHNLPEYLTYNNMTAAVESLLGRSDLICEVRARPQNPSPPYFTPRRSWLFAGPAFIDAIEGMPKAFTEVEGREERILLRDGRKRAKLIPPGPIVDETMRFLDLFDGAVTGLHLSFSDPTVRRLSNGLFVGANDGWTFLINTERRYLTRIFTGSMISGGRFYRGFWQEIPRSLRGALLIDGEPIAEYDYSACHLRLAYFAVGKRLEVAGGAGPDHYALDGFGPEWRPLIKQAVQILLNARTCRGASGAIASLSAMPERLWDRRFETARNLIDAIKKRHPALSPLWHTGCGLWLQFVDSQLAIVCATELIERGIVSLPIHDSMLVRAKDRDTLVEVMDRRFETDGPRLAAERFSGIERPKANGFRDLDLTLGRKAEGDRGVAARADLEPASASASRTPSPPGSASALSSRLSDLAAPPSIPGNSRPPDGDGALDLAPLRDNLIFRDFERVIAHRMRVSGAIMRSLLVVAAPLYPSQPAAARAVRMWLAELPGSREARVDNACFEAEVKRFVARKHRPIGPQSIARLIGVGPKLAARLGLVVVIPQRRKPAPSRRAKRLASTLPRIINIADAAPWGEPAMRSSWYKHHSDPVDRQVAALSAILASGDTAKTGTARASIARAERDRAALAAPKGILLVDRLLPRLKTTLASYDTTISNRSVDIGGRGHCIEYRTDGLGIQVWSKTWVGTDEGVRKWLDIVL